MPGGILRNSASIWKGLSRETIPAILYDGNTVAWYDYLKLVTKDVSDLVSVWGDQSGLSHDLLQAVGTNQPLWNTNGVLFDGVDNFMKTVAFTLNQPEEIWIVFKQVTWTSGEYMFDGDSQATGIFQQNTPSSDVRVYAGTASSNNVNMPINTFVIARILFNGVNSELQINETAITTGDFGALNMGGFTLGASGAGTTWSNIQAKEIIIRKVADTTVNEASIYSYLSTKYGI